MSKPTSPRIAPIARTLALALALASTACGAPQRWTPGTPSGGGEGWREVATPHFRLRTDFDAGEAPRIGAKLEEMFAELSELGFASDEPPKGSIDVVYFRRGPDYNAIFPGATAGVAFPRGKNDYERRPLIALGGDFVDETRRTLLHELTHQLVHYYYPQAPTWLDEGLARYFETFVIEDGTAILGRASKSARFWKGPWQSRWDARGWHTLIPMADAPPQAALRSMSARAFYGDMGADPTTSRGREALKPMFVHYEAAASLVRLLLGSSSYSPAFTQYLAKLHAGAPEPEAWASTVGLLPVDKLDVDYVGSLVPLEVSTLRTKVALPPNVMGAVRPVNAAEMRVLFARLRDWSTPAGRAAAHADLEASRYGEAGLEAVTTSAALAAAEGAPEQAEGILRAGIHGDAGERPLWNSLGWLALAKGGSELKGTLAKIEPELQGADTAAEIDLVAHVRFIEGEPDQALAGEKRALALDPNCVDCLAFVANVLAGKGLYREALETGTMAITFARESHVGAALLRSMDAWRARAETEKAAPESPPVPHADAVLAVLRGRFEECFSSGASDAGAVTLEAKVSARGEVTEVIPHEASLPAPVVDCLKGIVLHARFPAPGVDASVMVPVRTKGR
jgi:tetratricopeptide (TPR) repeat protein